MAAYCVLKTVLSRSRDMVGDTKAQGIKCVEGEGVKRDGSRQHFGSRRGWCINAGASKVTREREPRGLFACPVLWPDG